MSVVPAHFSVLTSVVRYQALGKLSTLGTQISQARKLSSPETKKLIKQAKQIVLWLQALDYSAYLTTDQVNQIKYSLIHIANIGEYPTAPVLANVNRPAILIGSGGGDTTVTNNYDAGQPVSNTDVDTGTETVFSLATSVGTSLMFHYKVLKGAASRSGILIVDWNSSAADCSEQSSPDLRGATDDLVLGATVSAGNVIIQATAASDNWSVTGKYYINE